MYWKEIRPDNHFNIYHKGNLAWSDIVKIIYKIKNKRKKGNKIQIEDDKIYILCKIKNKVLYVINVKIK